MPSKNEIAAAFQKASAELGYIEIRGLGHAPRISFPSGKGWVSHAASLGTDNYDHFCPYGWSGGVAGAVRHFPLALVVEAAEILQLPITSFTEEVPHVEITYVEPDQLKGCWDWQPGATSASLKPGLKSYGEGRIGYPSAILGQETYFYKRIEEWNLEWQWKDPVKKRYRRPQRLNPPDLTISPSHPSLRPHCRRCQYFSHEANYCAVNPPKLWKAADCSDYWEAGSDAV